jgi:Fe-S cluster biogenesis protein NfuA
VSSQEVYLAGQQPWETQNTLQVQYVPLIAKSFSFEEINFVIFANRILKSEMYFWIDYHRLSLIDREAGTGKSLPFWLTVCARVVIQEAILMADIKTEIQMKALVEQLSAYIETFHGGSVEYVDFDGKILKVRLGGACLGCPLSPNTLHGWVEGTVRQFFPDIQDVQAV